MRTDGRNRSVRIRCLLLCAGVAIGVSGCVWPRLPRLKNPFEKPPPCVFSSETTKTELFDHLNDNTTRLLSWRSSRVGIQLKQPGLPPFSLTANMAVEAPNRFRLQASMLGREEADFGSNDERFWFWIKQSPEPYIMTARHEQMAVAQRRLPIPFEPEWVMEAMGVIPFIPDAYEMQPVSELQTRLVKHQVTPTGESVRKEIDVNLCTGQITAHSLYNGQGELIARATMSEYLTDSHGVSIPYTIAFDWPRTGMKLKLSLLDVSINPNHIPEAIWELPRSLAPVVDIGTP
jgi:hypothetical protein